MSDADAIAAIESAAQAEAQSEASDQASHFARPVETPAGESTPQVQPSDAPQAPAESGESVDTFDGGQFNPDELPEELRPGWQQLQAAFTRKTQELAEQRKQVEALMELGDPETIQNEIELARRIQDPSNWVQLHSELSQHLQAMGLSPAEAAAEASAQMQEAHEADGMEPDFDLDALQEDPELAPLAGVVGNLQGQLQELRDEIARRDQLAAAERMHAALAGEMTRQEMAIRQANEHYTDDDVDFIYDFAVGNQGDLLKSQQALEDYVNRRIERYFASKESAARETAHQTLDASAQTEQVKAPETLEEAEAGALELVRQLQAAGEIETGF